MTPPRIMEEEDAAKRIDADADLPMLALSVRQPWAWAIIHAGKDVENRNWSQRSLLCQRGKIAVHASKGMTRAEYIDAWKFIKVKTGVEIPDAETLDRGGIIGSVDLVDIVRKSESPWFEGPRGLVLRDPRPCKFIQARGMLGFFKWREAS